MHDPLLRTSGDRIVHLLVALLVTAIAAAALLLLLASYFMTGAFAAQVPTGERSMGLVVPLVSSGAGAVLLCAAAALAVAVARSRRQPAMAPRRLLFAVGSISAGAFAVLLAWMENLGAWVAAAGFLVAGLGPIVATVLLALLVWHPARLVRGSGGRWGRRVLLLASVGGVGVVATLTLHALGVID
jgi:hypothetical protein